MLCSHLQGAEAAADADRAGAAGAGGEAQRGPPQRTSVADTLSPTPQQQQAQQKPLEANPLRGLGSALERWRARLAVRSDAPEPPQVRVLGFLKAFHRGRSTIFTYIYLHVQYVV